MARNLARSSWWYESAGERRGPVPGVDLLGLAASGEITPRTLVSFDDGSTWQTFREVAAEIERGASQPEAAVPAETAVATEGSRCTMCGRAFPAGELLSYGNDSVCAECKPVFLQRLRAGESPVRTQDYAGFWIRFGAKFIDGLILYAVNFAMQLVFMGAWGDLGDPAAAAEPGVGFFVAFCGMLLIQLGIAVAYTVYFLGRHGATPGKLVLKLRVRRSDGSALTYGRAFGRHFADMLSSMTLAIGYIIAAFDDQKRALHDHLCDTRVVRVG